MREQLTRALLRAFGLPSLPPVRLSMSDEARYTAAADSLLADGEPSQDVPLLTLLRWLAQERGVLFHGSSRDDLETLEPIRHTRDAKPFGDQQAVFAASDPVWAIYFATLRRGNGFRSTRNGSIGVPGSLYPRWYFFSHNEGAEREGRFGPGWLYVLPREGFVLEPPEWGIDSGQWASLEPITPIARVPIPAETFPFADRVSTHRLEESVTRTLLRSSRLRKRLAKRAMRV